jgi:hypothetical protein
LLTLSILSFQLAQVSVVEHLGHLGQLEQLGSAAKPEDESELARNRHKIPKALIRAQLFPDPNTRAILATLFDKPSRRHIY